MRWPRLGNLTRAHCLAALRGEQLITALDSVLAGGATPIRQVTPSNLPRAYEAAAMPEVFDELPAKTEEGAVTTKRARSRATRATTDRMSATPLETCRALQARAESSQFPASKLRHWPMHLAKRIGDENDTP